MPKDTVKSHTEKGVPFSEDVTKIKVATKEECVASLRAIVEEHPDKVITRNFFRVNSDFAESAWNKHFGTFQEFKRQAGITLSRHQHRLERDIAKHASTENYMKLNAKKASWAGLYKKPSGKRFKTVLVISDVHDKYCDPFVRRVFMATAKIVQPDVVVLNGDIFDLYEFGKYAQDPREYDVIGRIKWVHDFLKQLRNACPDAEFNLIEGNHEFRLLRHLSEATPALKNILADLHGFDVPSLLGLTEFEINYVSNSNLATFTERDIKAELSRNYWIGWDCLLAHHFPTGRNMGLPGFNGHHHRHFVWSSYSPIYGSFEWHQLGAAHMRRADYCNGEQWGNGFLMVHVDVQTKKSQFEYVQIGDHCMVGGTWYERTKAEYVTRL
jgi:hypothetical protein